MKTEQLYDKGSAPYVEDGLFLCDPFYGVVDGVSAPYGPKHPLKLTDGKSGGELVARTIEQYVQNRPQKDLKLPTLEQLTLEVDYNLETIQDIHHLPTGELSGATFAFAKVGERHVEIVQGGDCFALWKLHDGTVGITKNQVRLHDTAMNAEILRTQREVAKELFGVSLEEATQEQRGKIRGEMWNRFYFTLKEARNQDANNPASPRRYTLLNGQLLQKSEEPIWFSTQLPRDQVQLLLLFSDGLIPWQVMGGMSDEQIARKVLTDYERGGLKYLLEVARGIEKCLAAVNYTDAAEATAIALQF